MDRIIPLIEYHNECRSNALGMVYENVATAIDRIKFNRIAYFKRITGCNNYYDVSDSNIREEWSNLEYLNYVLLAVHYRQPQPKHHWFGRIRDAFKSGSNLKLTDRCDIFILSAHDWFDFQWASKHIPYHTDSKHEYKFVGYKYFEYGKEREPRFIQVVKSIDLDDVTYVEYITKTDF